MIRRRMRLVALLGLVVGSVHLGGGTADADPSAVGERLRGVAGRLTTGFRHSCVLLDTGQISCWGFAGNGQLGYGNTTDIGDNEMPSANTVNGGVVALPGGQAATSVATGAYITCAVLASGDVTCWGTGQYGGLGYGNLNPIGDNETPATNPVNGGIVDLPGTHTARELAIGTDHTCALLDDGNVSCWGLGDTGSLGYGNTNEIGDDETPAANPVNGGIVDLPGDHIALAITAGWYHTCAILDDGSVTCWGDGGFGQLGYGNAVQIGDNETPATNPYNGGIVDLPGAHTATAISAGQHHTCAILDDGNVTCWGRGLLGSLGYGNTDDIGDDETPAANPVNGGIVDLPGTNAAVAIAVGDTHTCAVLDDGDVTCWGEGGLGRLGYGNVNTIGDTETPAANPVNSGIVPLPGDSGAIAVAADTFGTCVLLAAGEPVCWGSNSWNQLGYGVSGAANGIGDDETPAQNPTNGGIVRLPGNRTVESVSGGYSHSCALLNSGQITCWGFNGDGELGYGNIVDIGDTETAAANPVNGGIVRLPGGRTATAVTVGDLHTCALLADGQVSCWGWNGEGQLGYGNTATIGDNDTPADNPVNGGLVALPAGRTAVAVSAGGLHTCALLDNGRIACWGANDEGQLGYGNTEFIGEDETPADNTANGGVVRLPGDARAVAVAAGRSHTCAILATGSVACWGAGTNGKLGYSNTQTIGDNETPFDNATNGGVVALPGGQAARALALGGNHTCAQLANGGLSCWGYAANGQLGYGNANNIGDTETPAANPANSGVVKLPGLQTVQGISAGTNHTCALLANGTASCWGVGSIGQLGYGDNISRGFADTPFDNSVNGGVVALPGASSALAVELGSDTSCAILADHTLSCWGSAQQGRLGYGNTNHMGDTETPAANPVNGGIVPVAQSVSAVDYRSLVPARLLDTRSSGVTIDGQYQAGGQRAAGSSLVLTVLRRGGVPADAVAVTLSVAAVAPAGNGNVAAWPCDAEMPLSSSLNYQTGTTTANTVMSRVAADGTICLRTSAATHLIADVVGYTPRTSSLTSFNPARLIDTRPGGTTDDGLRQAEGTRAALSTTTVQIAGRGEVPATARTAVLNVTAVAPGGNGFMTVFPCGTLPNASNINYTSGNTASNLVIAQLDATGQVCVYTSQAAHLLIDVVGSYIGGQPGPQWARSLAPARITDTRASGVTADGRYQATGVVAGGSTFTVQVAGRYPANAADVAFLNVTAVAPAGNGNLTVWPCDQPKPNASSLNYATSTTRAVQVLTKLSASGTVCIATTQNTHLIVDINGTTL